MREILARIPGFGIYSPAIKERGPPRPVSTLMVCFRI